MTGSELKARVVGLSTHALRIVRGSLGIGKVIEEFDSRVYESLDGKRVFGLGRDMLSGPYRVAYRFDRLNYPGPEIVCID